MANTSPAADMGCLISESKRLLNSSLSHNTHKAYQAALNKLQSFLTHYGLHQTWPLHHNTVLYFIAYLSIQKLSPKSVPFTSVHYHTFTKLTNFQTQPSHSKSPKCYKAYSATIDFLLTIAYQSRSQSSTN
jgi:site-specific recombinase XerD